MSETLIERIKKIENLPPYITTVDKKTEMQNAFEEWRKKNNVVRAVRKGETTFHQEYQKVFGGYNFENLLTQYSWPQGFWEKSADLVACIDSPHLRLIPNNLVEGVEGGADLGLTASLLGGSVEHIFSQRLTKRELLRMAGIGTTAFTIAGGALGTAHTYIISSRLRLVEQNALYLDRIHTKLYENQKGYPMDRRAFLAYLVPETKP